MSNLVFFILFYKRSFHGVMIDEREIRTTGWIIKGEGVDYQVGERIRAQTIQRNNTTPDAS